MHQHVGGGYLEGVAAAEDAHLVLFGEEIGQNPPLPVLLAEAQERLRELRDRYGDVLPADERFELVSSALDELEVALESVRAARERLGRIETRLVLAFDAGIARLRSAERELEGAG